MHMGMAEKLQKPEQARRTLAADPVVNHYPAIGRYTLGADQVLDNPEKRRQRPGASVHQADAENVQTPRSRDVSVSKVFWRSQVQDDQLRIVSSIL